MLAEIVGYEYELCMQQTWVQNMIEVSEPYLSHL